MNSRSTGKKIVRILRDMLILIAIGNVTTYFIYPEMQWTISRFLMNSMFSVIVGFPVWRGSGYITYLLEKRLPWLKYPIKRLLAQIGALLLFALIIFFLLLVAWISLSDTMTFQDIKGSAITSIKIMSIFLITSIIITNGIIFFVNWREAAIKQEELKRAHLDLQYQSLRAQTNPHFLFNSLSSLVVLIKRDTDKATEFVHKLSDVYRYVLDQGEHELVTVKEEMNFLNDYIFLQKIRFGESLRVTINLDSESSLMVLPLSLQMMVENAIKHNEFSIEHPLNIEITISGDNHVVIKNSLNKKEAIEPSSGLGMKNLEKRISFFSDSQLLVEETGDTYTVTIPTITS